MSSTPSPYRPKPLAPDLLAGDAVKPGDRRFGLIWVNPERLGGTPCFYGTRVPVQTMWDYIEGGEALDRFVADFPGVTREHALAVLELARRGLGSAGQAA